MRREPFLNILKRLWLYVYMKDWLHIKMLHLRTYNINCERVDILWLRKWLQWLDPLIIDHLHGVWSLSVEEYGEIGANRGMGEHREMRDKGK